MACLCRFVIDGRLAGRRNFLDSDLGTRCQAQMPVGNDRLANLNCSANRGDVFFRGQCFDTSHFNTGVVLDGIKEIPVGTLLDGSARNGHCLSERIEQQADIEELPGGQCFVPVR